MWQDNTFTNCFSMIWLFVIYTDLCLSQQVCHYKVAFMFVFTIRSCSYLSFDCSSIFSAIGGSTNPCFDTFSGDSPGSEAETANIVNFLRQNGQNIDAYLTVHSYGQMWLYPWGFTSALPADYLDLVCYIVNYFFLQLLYIWSLFPVLKIGSCLFVRFISNMETFWNFLHIF
jgi:hypothetical protein